MGYFGGGSVGGASPGPNSVGSATVIDKSLLPVDLQDGTIPGQLLVTGAANEWTRSPAPATAPSVQPVFMLAGEPTRPSAPVVITQLATGATGNLHEWRSSAGSILSRIAASGAVFHSSTLAVGSAAIPANTQMAISLASAAVRGLFIQGVASQTANLLEFQNSISQIIARMDPAGKLQSARYILQVPSVGGPDLSLVPVTGGQSVLATWHGFQINALRLGTPDYSPANISGADDYHVIIPLNQAAKVGVGIRAKAAQTGDLQQWQDSAGTVLSRVSATGILFGNGSGLTNVPVGVHTHDAMAITSGILDGDRLPSMSAGKNGAVPPTGMPFGGFLRDDGTWQEISSGNLNISLDQNGNPYTVYNFSANSLTANGSGARLTLSGTIDLSGPTGGNTALIYDSSSDVLKYWSVNANNWIALEAGGGGGGGYALISEDVNTNMVTISNGFSYGGLRLSKIVLEGVYPVTIFAPPNGQAEQYTWPYTQNSLGTLSAGDLVLTHSNGSMAWKTYAP